MTSGWLEWTVQVAIAVLQLKYFPFDSEPESGSASKVHRFMYQPMATTEIMNEKVILVKKFLLDFYLDW